MNASARLFQAPPTELGVTQYGFCYSDIVNSMHACVCVLTAHLHSEFLQVEVQYVRGGADSSLSLVVLG